LDRFPNLPPRIGVQQLPLSPILVPERIPRLHALGRGNANTQRPFTGTPACLADHRPAGLWLTVPLPTRDAVPRLHDRATPDSAATVSAKVEHTLCLGDVQHLPSQPLTRSARPPVQRKIRWPSIGPSPSGASGGYSIAPRTDISGEPRKASESMPAPFHGA